MASPKITLDQARALLARMGLPIGGDGQNGFVPQARGGRSGFQPVKAAARIELTYRTASGYTLASRDLDDFPEAREEFRWAVDKAEAHGFAIVWPGAGARLELTRAATEES